MIPEVSFVECVTINRQALVNLKCAELGRSPRPYKHRLAELGSFQCDRREHPGQLQHQRDQQQQSQPSVVAR